MSLQIVEGDRETYVVILPSDPITTKKKVWIILIITAHKLCHRLRFKEGKIKFR